MINNLQLLYVLLAFVVIDNCNPEKINAQDIVKFVKTNYGGSPVTVLSSSRSLNALGMIRSISRDAMMPVKFAPIATPLLKPTDVHVAMITMEELEMKGRENGSIIEALSVVLEKGGKKAKLPESIPSALDAGTSLMRHSTLSTTVPM